MATQELKICPKCQDWQFCEWQVDNEIAGEPLFSLMCCACGHTFDAEQPVLFPKDLEVPHETEVSNAHLQSR